MALRVFASHDWGADGATHARVAQVVRGLRARGLAVWFDETHMRRNILDAMCKGIDTSDVILVFVTDNYLAKVARGKDTDNVRREFMYAARNPARLLPVRFDADLPAAWPGPVGMLLGEHLYTDLSVYSEEAVDALAEAVRRCTPQTRWKTAAQRARSRAIVARKEPRKESPQPCAELAVHGKGTARARVERVAGALGCAGIGTHEHLGAALDRLLRSLRGTHGMPGAEMAFCARLAYAEREAGVE